MVHIGIALLLFIVGLKLDLNLMRTTGPVALATGLGQSVFLAGVPLASTAFRDSIVRKEIRCGTRTSIAQGLLDHERSDAQGAVMCRDSRAWGCTNAALMAALRRAVLLPGIQHSRTSDKESEEYL